MSEPPEPSGVDIKDILSPPSTRDSSSLAVAVGGTTVPAANLPPDDGGQVAASTPMWRLALHSFLENRLAVVGVGVLVLFIAFSFLGPLVYRTDQVNTDIANTFLPPGGANPLGTESHGFDVLGRLMTGGQSSLEIAFLSAVIATVIGTLYGALAGLSGGILDAAMMRIVDVLLAIPFLFIVLIIATRFNASVLSLSLLLGAFSWLVPARLVRGEVLSLRSRDFVSAARVMGAGPWRLIIRHLVPNALGVVVVNITFQVADALLAVSALGFLGFGLAYPQVSWGDMLSDGISYLLSGYWWLIYPVGLCLVLVVMASNFIGDALRDAMDVRLRRR